jgi:large subunit ribosomal protein L15
MINNLPSPKTNKKSVRVGRGIGTGRGGHTTGKGTKGQRSRSGYKKPRPGFEGGQNPLSKRLPKLKNVSGSRTRTRLFKIRKEKNSPVKLSSLAETFKDGETVTYDKLIDTGLISPVSNKRLIIKVLFDTDIDKKLVIEGIPVSKTAGKAIEKAGGTIKAEA